MFGRTGARGKTVRFNAVLFASKYHDFSLFVSTRFFVSTVSFRFDPIFLSYFFSFLLQPCPFASARSFCLIFCFFFNPILTLQPSSEVQHCPSSLGSTGSTGSISSTGPTGPTGSTELTKFIYPIAVAMSIFCCKRIPTTSWKQKNLFPRTCDKVLAVLLPYQHSESI